MNMMNLEGIDHVLILRNRNTNWQTTQKEWHEKSQSLLFYSAQAPA